MDSAHEKNYKLFSNLIKPAFDITIDSSISNPQYIPDEGSGILISNHRSDLDPFLIMVNSYRPVNWIGARYLWNIPFLNLLFDGIGAIPISKRKKDIHEAIDKAIECLEDGQLVGIFPEGWDYIAQNQFDWSVGKFQTGFARMAFQTGAPIVPIAMLGLKEQRGIQAFSPRIRKFFDYPIELQYIKGRVVYKKIHINVGKPIPCPTDADPDNYKSVKEFAQHVNEVVRQLYEDIPENVVGFDRFEPITAEEGVGKPMPEDEFADDILEAVVMVRRKTKDAGLEYDEELLERLENHHAQLEILRSSEDKNVRRMAAFYIEWLSKIDNAIENGANINEWFQQYLRKPSRGPKQFR